MRNHGAPATAWGRITAALAAVEGLSQDDLAEVLSCDRATVSRKIAGTRPFTERDQQRLAARLDSTAEQLQADLLILRATRQYRAGTTPASPTTTHAA